MKKQVMFAAFLTLIVSGSVSALPIVNGSFEADPFTANGDYELDLSGGDVTGWFIPSSNGTYPWGLQDGAFGAFTPYGIQWVVLGEDATNTEFSIQQTLTGLVSGQTYTVSFAIASEIGCCSIAEVSFLSGSPTPAQTIMAPSSGQYWTDWATHSMNFLATDTSAILQFKNLVLSQTDGEGVDLGLDNVEVFAAEQVPATSLSGLLAMMALLLVSLTLIVAWRSRPSM